MVCAQCKNCARCSQHAVDCVGCVDKAAFLAENGWTEVPGDGDTTCWKAPTRFTQTPLYFALEAAYELETSGEGVWAYAGKVALAEALYSDDLRRMDEQEAKRFAKTGVRLGVPPNY